MKNLKERRLEVLNDTIRYYSEDVNRRCVQPDGGCRYSGETVGKDTDGCAIGRLLKPKIRKKLDERWTLGIDIKSLLEGGEGSLLIPKHVAVLGKGFLEALQELHDEDCHWDSSGLTSRGRDQVNYIKHRYIDLN